MGLAGFLKSRWRSVDPPSPSSPPPLPGGPLAMYPPNIAEA